MFRKKTKTKEIPVWNFDLASFQARVTPERIDIETKGKTWKICFFVGSVEYQMLAPIFVPEAFPNNPQAVELAKSKEAQDKTIEAIKMIAQILYAVSNNIVYEPKCINDFFVTLNTIIERRDIKESPISKSEEAQILAEEKALHEPTEENVVAAIEASENKPKLKKNGSKNISRNPKKRN